MHLTILAAFVIGALTVSACVAQATSAQPQMTTITDVAVASTRNKALPTFDVMKNAK